MKNQKRRVRGFVKVYTDVIKDKLDIFERPLVIKLAIAEALSLTQPNYDYYERKIKEMDSKTSWDLPDVIADNDYLLLKHILIEKYEKELDDSRISDELAVLLEIGTHALYDKINNLRKDNPIDDLYSIIIN
ncbi:hypothetical protein [Paenibacillus sp. FSL W7-1287]|uniref:hypothetical protein n=1 Tax=Paenibacillus sp. FSL W7-1287 TaxID=2954538 RepID=UPI0030FC5013